MAGGKFDKLAGKTRPGTYINFQSERTDTVGTSERGTTIIPLMKPAYGPAGSYIELTNAGPDTAYDKLGFSVYDSDANRQMLLLVNQVGHGGQALVERDGVACQTDGDVKTCHRVGSFTEIPLAVTSSYSIPSWNFIPFITVCISLSSITV